MPGTKFGGFIEMWGKSAGVDGEETTGALQEGRGMNRNAIAQGGVENKEVKRAQIEAGDGGGGVGVIWRKGN